MAASPRTVGIVGLGFGRAHIPAFQSNGCEVIAVSQRDDKAARAVADRYGVPRVFARWQDLLADQQTLKFKSIEEIRALFTRAGVAANQTVVTYCAIGMRASLMYWAARAAGVQARVYVGSYSDWQRDPGNPIVR